jgi:hypothetical protein
MKITKNNNNNYHYNNLVFALAVPAVLSLSLLSWYISDLSAGLGAQVQNTNVPFAFNGTANSDCIIDDVDSLFMYGYYYIRHADFHNIGAAT